MSLEESPVDIPVSPTFDRSEEVDGVETTGSLPRPWHCFGPLLQVRSEGSQPRRTSTGRGFGVCFCSGGHPGRISGHEVGCSMFPTQRAAGPWRCAILPADSDGEVEPVTPPVSTPPSELAVPGENLEGSIIERTAPRNETISVTSTCSPSPAMDSPDTELLSRGSKATAACLGGDVSGHGVVRCEGPSAAAPEIKEVQKSDAPSGPFPAEFEYEPVAAHATKQKTFSSNWERAVAYHHGLYMPEKSAAPQTADDVRVAVSDFAAKVHQYQIQPETAAKKCMKWWDDAQPAMGCGCGAGC
eukprot:Skav225916  [mRNA]  locus=scaffold1500:156308:169664:- [translate_table: standard]